MLLVGLLALRLGRGVARIVLRVLVAYYFLARPEARRSSREFMSAVGARTDRLAVYAHMLRFAECTLDRVFFLTGRMNGIAVHEHGFAPLQRTLEQGRGAVLVSAHLGSFEVLRCAARARRHPLHAVLDLGHAARTQAVLARLSGEQQPARLVDARLPPIELALQLHDIVTRGELVGLMADREMGPRSAVVPFLGRRARFPTGPFLLAAALRCPIFLVLGLSTAPRRYDLYCEAIAERIDLPRPERERALAALVESFAARLEHYCRKAPDNWFNFFPFFMPAPPVPARPGETAPLAARPGARASRP